MFDIGFGELLVCAIVALLVLGPERLPTAARTVGRWVGRARQTVTHFTDQIDREIRAEEVKRRIDEEIRKSGVNDIARQVNDALHAPLKTPDLIAPAATPPTTPTAPTAAPSASPAAPAAGERVPENRIDPPAAADTVANATPNPDTPTDRT